jgi:hypothetical protein
MWSPVSNGVKRAGGSQKLGLPAARIFSTESIHGGHRAGPATSFTAGKGIPHALVNPTNSLLHLVAIFTPDTH